MKTTPYILLSIFLLQSCGRNDTTNTPEIDPEVVPLSITATSELNPPDKIVMASVSPKPGFTSWTGHIFLLSESGKILATNTGFSGFTDIDTGPFADIHGLARGDLPSVLLALSEAGEIKAFIETAETGFKPLPVSSNNFEATALCAVQTPSESSFYVTAENGVQKYDFVVTDTSLIEFTKTELFKSLEVKNCSIDDSGTIYALKSSGTLTLLNQSQTTDIFGNIDQFAKMGSSDSAVLLLQSDKNVLAVKTPTTYANIQIDPGLSIRGLDESGWVFSTSAPMGNTFNAGLTLIGDKNSHRIVMIANDYLIGAVSTPSSDQD